jgi:ATP-dependent RNA helicase DDX46/PRP5
MVSFTLKKPTSGSSSIKNLISEDQNILTPSSNFNEPNSVTVTFPGPIQNEAASIDELDLFMTKLVNEAPEAKMLSEIPLGSSVHGSMVTMEDIEKMHQGNNLGVSPLESVAKEEEDLFHRKFIESFKKQKELDDQISYENLLSSSSNSKLQDSLASSFALLDDNIPEEESYGQTNVKVDALKLLQEKLEKKQVRSVQSILTDSNETLNPIRKNFYIPHQEILMKSPFEIEEIYRVNQIHIISTGKEQVKVWNSSKNIDEVKKKKLKAPRPIVSWDQVGFSTPILEMLESRHYYKPFPIQCISLPIIMSGYDYLAIAPTGSGKTLAYLLPMLRHVLDQPLVTQNEGPIGLVLVPSRELVVQIYSELKKLIKILKEYSNVKVTAIYGGANMIEQISLLKSGSDIIIATPGRFIDILTLNKGIILSLKRTTFVVLDEADRLFDVGFAPQISSILDALRDDRQLIMFSATLPSSISTLAKKYLHESFIEVMIGSGRAIASSKIVQQVEVFTNEHEKFFRLLQVLGEHEEIEGCIIIFVDSQEKCDFLYTSLINSGYSSTFPLHAGINQDDRDSFLTQFKNGSKRILITTGLLARGLDVASCFLVINFDVPNHLEEYIHRIGRTGRGNKDGLAITFILRSEKQYSIDLIRALKDSHQSSKITVELQEIADEFQKELDAGTAKRHRSGFSGTKGYKFDEEERKLAIQKKRRLAGVVDEEEEEEEEEENEDGDDIMEDVKVGEVGDHVTEAAAAPTEPEKNKPDHSEPQTSVNVDSIALAKARAAAAAFSIASSKAPGSAPIAATPQATFTDELEINDYPMQARQKLMKDTFQRIKELSGGCVVSTRGVYIAPNVATSKEFVGQKKLYLLFQAPSEIVLKRAKNEIIRVLEDETRRVAERQK